MKLRSVFLILTLFIFTLGLSWSIYYLVSAGQNSFNIQVGDYLVSVIDSNEERIGDIFNEIEGDVSFLVDSEKVKDIFKKEVRKSEAAAKFDVEGKVSIVVREVENYLRSHSYLTLDELVENNEFRAIATQKVGDTGYAGLLDAKTTMTYIHIDPKIEGIKIFGSDRTSEELDIILQDAIEKGVGEGFYDWEDVNGEIRRKYLEARKIGTPTADGVTLLLVTTAYVDDYLVAQNVSESLENYFIEFIAARNYHNILFVSKDNRVVFMVGTGDGLGSNLKNVVNGFGDTNSLINDIKSDDLGFYGPFIGHVGDAYLQFAVASRVYSEGEFFGTLVIIDDMDSVNGVLKEAEGSQSGELDEDYIVNARGLLITPLRSRNVDVMVQDIRTESVGECLADLMAAIKKGITVEEYQELEEEDEVFLEFLNFNGDLTLGLDRPIGRANWCLLSDVNAQDVLSEPMEKSFRSQILFRLWVMLAVVILVTMTSFFIDKRYVLEKKKKIFRENFFTRLSLWSYFLFAIIFAAVYLFVVTQFFQGIQNAKLFDDIPDMLVFVAGVMIFAVGMKIRNMKVRYFIIYGGLLICLRRLLDIPLQEYQILSGITLVILWIPVIIFEFVGFLLLLIGYRRLKNG